MAPKGSRTHLLAKTHKPADDASDAEVSRVPHLTILHHPVLSRIGEETSLAGKKRIAVSRTEPDFHRVDGTEPWPLGDPFVSRSPIHLAPAEHRLTITPGEAAVSVNGEVLRSPKTFDERAVENGLIIELGGRVILNYHLRRPRGALTGELGLIGASEALEELRRNILRVADLQVPVLLLGETGTGKELIAAAIHRASPRNRGPFEAVNLGAFAPNMAAAELFGHAKGAFTGAIADNPGYFVRASEGTLFLDEIGEAPNDVQVSLLRALETSTVQGVGQQGAQKVDARIISATDADLNLACAEGRFRAALLHRLRGFEIRVPALDERRDDLGRLMVHFFHQTAAELGEQKKLTVEEPLAKPYLSAATALPFFLYGWPGNVRELRNAVRQLLIANRGAQELKLDRTLAQSLSAGELDRPADPRREVEQKRRRPSDVGEQELIDALTRHRWRIAPAAKALGISASALHMSIDRSARIRRATDLRDDEIRAAQEEVGDSLELLAEKLQVSARGLRLRLKAKR